MIRSLRPVRAGLFLALALLAPATSAEPPARGHLLLNGGGGETDDYWRKLLELAGGADAEIVILPTASERPEAGAEYESELREKWHATHARWLPLRAREDASRPEIVEALDRATAIFFVGGDQNRITDALLGTAAFDAIAGVFARGGVLAGSSAGLACMSRVMITGEGDFGVLRAGAVETRLGLGFLEDAILDQHFVTRQRANRLLTVVLEHGLPGLGVDEETAVWIAPDGTIEVLGARSVVVFDPRGAAIRSVPEERPRLGATGVALHVYLPGERFRLDVEPLPAPAH